MVDPATSYPLHPQEDVETPPQEGVNWDVTVPEPPVQTQPHYADVYQPPVGTQPQSIPSATEIPPSTLPETSNSPATSSKKTLGSPSSTPGFVQPEPEQLIVEWEALSRPFKKRSRQYFSTVAIIVLLISLILFFAGQFLPIAVVIAVAFLGYVLSVVPPQRVTNSFTTYGVRMDNKLYNWEELTRFWFDTKYGERLVCFEITQFPGRLTLLLGDLSNEETKEFLSTIMLYQKPEPTFMDKAAEWIQEKIPLEADQPVKPS